MMLSTVKNRAKINIKNFEKMIIVISLGIGLLAAFIVGACLDPSYTVKIAFSVHLPNVFYTLAVI